ncbi:hypothetical protein RHJ63_06585 [Thermosynechococcus sp. JY1334]|uniref:hypothetical protein n=2 Tax=Thermosynechococcus TaxID=146785 RepID=UPI002673DDDA|nr:MULTISPECIES: hypothetical protein [unclassified Thermosynechococcus]MDR7897976.1 hypothetical protein [Thermosynechococcus sp. JY1332]MDR7905376.1 hypothetical protein [Thermosynechococcus sp. JY1334]WKT85112.1 hypothetical protein QYC30_06555 [Thermosynechococcus sp. JY1339]WNC54054.1 hypothetical protein RHJ31_06540 [Thermosynechococcus sp. JY1331]
MTTTTSPIATAAQQIVQHPQHNRLFKLLYALQQNQWPTQTPPWTVSEVQQAVIQILERLKTPTLLGQRLTAIVNSLNKAQAYQVLSAALLQILVPLYTQSPTATLTIEAPTFSTADLYDLRLEVTRYCTPLQMKLLVAALLTTKPVHAQGLERFTLIDLLQRLTRRYGDLEILQTQMAAALARLPDDPLYASAGDRLIKLLSTLYQRYPQNQPPEDTLGSTPPTVIPAVTSQTDAEEELTCQLFLQSQ